MNKHTPGPWVAVARTNSHVEIEAPDHAGYSAYSAKKIATLSANNFEANARLIAAAPDLLEALEKLACLGNGDQYGNSEGNMIARAAIAKATGETK